MNRDVTVWYDRGGNYLEVIFERREGPGNGQRRRDGGGHQHVIGFSILNDRQDQSEAPASVPLATQRHALSSCPLLFS